MIMLRIGLREDFLPEDTAVSGVGCNHCLATISISESVNCAFNNRDAGVAFTKSRSGPQVFRGIRFPICGGQMFV